MFFRAVSVQTFFRLKKRSTLFTFYFWLGLTLLNFVSNVLEFQGTDVLLMYHPMKLLLLSYNRASYQTDIFFTFVQLYPLLVVIPSGFSLAREKQTGEEIYITVRLGHHAYGFSKLISAFLTTFIVFTVPVFLEILLNCLSFPLAATGDLSNWSYYDINYINSVHNYLLSGLYIFALFVCNGYGNCFWNDIGCFRGIYSGFFFGR